MISKNNKSVVVKQSDQEQDDAEVIVSVMGIGATKARPTSVIIRIQGSGAARARPASVILTLASRALGTGAIIPRPTI